MQVRKVSNMQKWQFKQVPRLLPLILFSFGHVLSVVVFVQPRRVGHFCCCDGARVGWAGRARGVRGHRQPVVSAAAPRSINILCFDRVGFGNRIFHLRVSIVRDKQFVAVPTRTDYRSNGTRRSTQETRKRKCAAITSRDK